MIDELQEIFCRVFGLNDYTITEKQVIMELPSVSSLSLLMAINEIEMFYDIEIPNSVLKKFVTVKDIIKYLKSKGK